LASDDRLARRGARADDIRIAESVFDRLAARPAPQANLRLRKDGLHRLGVRAALDAGADDGDHARARPGESPRRDSRHRGRADLGDRRRVEEGEELAGLAVVEQDGETGELLAL